MSAPKPEEPAIAATLLERYLDDLAGGRERSVADYQAMFPGHEDLVARELARLQSGDAPEGAVPPEQLAHYELLGEIGRGGQGLVYRARDTRLKREVALKVLDRPALYATVGLERFRREAEVAARLDHPGICSVLDTGVADGVTYIAMRLVDGESLAQRLAAQTEPPAGRGAFATLATLFARAARAVHAAHEAGIVHRDIKPGNIMVTVNGDPVLLDFGLARDESRREAGLTESGDVFGTPAYMSPEQLRGEVSRVDRRTDVYALGAALFEALTLRPPFVAPSRDRLFRAILEQEPRSPQNWNRQVPTDLAAIALTALDKDPGHRYATAEAMAEDLERYVRREPIRARPASAWTRANRWVARNRAIAALAGTLVVVMAVALVWIVIQNRELAAELEDARAGRANKHQRRVQELTTTAYQRLFSADSAGADEMFEAVLELQPGHRPALAGLLWSVSQDPASVRSVLDRLEVLDADDPDALWMRATGLTIAGETAAAEPYFERAGDVDTALRCYFKGLREVRGFLERDPRSAARGLVWFRKAVMLAPTPEFHYYHSLLYAASLAGDGAAQDEAASALEHHWAGSPATLEAIAQFYMQRDPARAAAALRELFAVQPSAAGAMGLAHVAMQGGDLAEARAWYDRGIALQDDFAPIWFARARLLERLEDWDAARSDYRRALELMPDFTMARDALAALEGR